jgi:hypothetical protein
MLVFTMPFIKGFNSAAPKYSTPITVVNASMEPSKIIRKLGIISAFRVYIEAFSFSFASSSVSKHSFVVRV